MLPAKAVNQAPKYRYAVLSVVRTSQIAELESSCEAEGDADRMFRMEYSRWGLTDTNYYLVDWKEQRVIKSHIATDSGPSGGKT